MSSETPEPPQNREPSHSLHYFIGLGIGLIPLILALISVRDLLYGSGLYGFGSGGFIVASILYLIEIIVTIAFLFSKERRFIGYGLLTMVLISPVVVFIACTVKIP